MFRCLPGALSLSFVDEILDAPPPSLCGFPSHARALSLRALLSFLPTTRSSLFSSSLSFSLPFFPSLLRPLSRSTVVYIYVYRLEAAHPRAHSVHRTVDRETFDLTAKPDRQKAFFCRPERDGERACVRERKRVRGGDKGWGGGGGRLEAGLKDLTDDLRPRLE